ncbi:MAG: hypothetical protein J0I54_13270 [Bosea sp.]|uniref:hypothetical protein n=1 Tax=unclassified Bosea (in: a-proteobacteria) TaxID=2653178 RepID=UPI000B049A0F|nr:MULTISPECIES: hypothetical protein [unclassified Bosea (in: a-proteobacteria)]MBN9457592.1 hypothetical protein [Bosea sp. (in: a-proteobacteria)]
MLNDSLAPAKRALIFFGCMGALVAGLTYGAGLQIPSDRSSATVAQMRGAPAETQFAAVDRADRGETVVRRAIPAPSKQAMVEGEPRIVLR